MSMKKMFFVSALAVGLLSACSNDDVAVAPSAPEGLDVETGLVPVELSMRSPMSIVTRGMGTVGGVGEGNANNIWRGETLYFNMYMKATASGTDTLGVSYWENGIEGVNDPVRVANFDNEPIAITTSMVGENAIVQGVGPKYYPADASRHDFFAYHIDDAAVETEETSFGPCPVLNTEYDEEGDSLARKSVKFRIDGSQDLMVGRANSDATADCFSAKSARDGVPTPVIDMRHLLTRFSFEVVAGDKTAAGLEVQEIAVVSRCSGRMLVVWHPSQAPASDLEKIIWDETVDTLFLMQRPVNEEGATEYLQKLDSIDAVTLTWNDELDIAEDTIPVGEALMVEPNKPEYVVLVKTKQELEGGSTNIFWSTGIIRFADEGNAMPGTSYKVLVKLYGLYGIELETSLTSWYEGEDITVDTAE